MPDITGYFYALVNRAGMTDGKTVRFNQATGRFEAAPYISVETPDGDGVALLEGGNDFSGLQSLDLTGVPLLDSADIMAGAEFSIISGVKNGEGDFIYGLAVARLDLSGIGGPSLIENINMFIKNPANDEYLMTSLQNSSEDPVRLSHTTIPNFQVLNMFMEESVRAILQSGTPELPDDVVTLEHLNGVMSGAVGSTGGVAAAVKYGRNAGGKWALVCNPGFYKTADVGPLNRDGIRFRGRVCIFEPDFNLFDEYINFYEIITQFRNADGATFDQDNLEIAITMHGSRLGIFTEDCLIGTPAPVPGGEYNEGRVYTDTNDSYSGLDYSLGEAIEFRLDYVYDVAGRWVKKIWVRTDRQFYSPADGDLHEILSGESNLPWGDPNSQDVYWKLIRTSTPEDFQVGSIFDAELFFYVGRNGGLMGVEYAQLSHIDSEAPGGEELILDFQSRNIDPVTGVCTSTLVSGQTFTPFASDSDEDNFPLPVIDNSHAGVYDLQERIAALEP